MKFYPTWEQIVNHQLQVLMSQFSNLYYPSINLPFLQPLAFIQQVFILYPSYRQLLLYPILLLLFFLLVPFIFQLLMVFGI